MKPKQYRMLTFSHIKMNQRAEGLFDHTMLPFQLKPGISFQPQMKRAEWCTISVYQGLTYSFFELIKNLLVKILQAILKELLSDVHFVQLWSVNTPFLSQLCRWGHQLKLALLISVHTQNGGS